MVRKEIYLLTTSIMPMYVFELSINIAAISILI